MSLDNYIAPRVKLLENTADHVKFTLQIPADLPHLEGHFPGQPVTPSIVLIEISSLLIHEYFGVASRSYKSLKKSKTARMVFPEIEHFIVINKLSESSYKAEWRDGEDQLCAKFIIDY